MWLRGGGTATACQSRYDVVYDTQAGGLSWFVRILGKSSTPGAGGAAGTAVVRQPEWSMTGEPTELARPEPNPQRRETPHGPMLAAAAIRRGHPAPLPRGCRAV